jgi:hypothetical protein
VMWYISTLAVAADCMRLQLQGASILLKVSNAWPFFFNIDRDNSGTRVPHE